MPTPSADRRVYDSVLDSIGWTPLIRLTRVTKGIATPVWVKAETRNPGGSVKDRIGMPIIEAAEREGRLKPGGTIVEGTSGNTGVALAIAAALKGYRHVLAHPATATVKRVNASYNPLPALDTATIIQALHTSRHSALRIA